MLHGNRTRHLIYVEENSRKKKIRQHFMVTEWWNGDQHTDNCDVKWHSAIKECENALSMPEIIDIR